MNTVDGAGGRLWGVTGRNFYAECLSGGGEPRVSGRFWCHVDPAWPVPELLGRVVPADVFMDGLDGPIVIREVSGTDTLQCRFTSAGAVRRVSGAVATHELATSR